MHDRVIDDLVSCGAKEHWKKSYLLSICPSASISCSCFHAYVLDNSQVWMQSELHWHREVLQRTWDSACSISNSQKPSHSLLLTAGVWKVFSEKNPLMHRKKLTTNENTCKWKNKTEKNLLWWVSCRLTNRKFKNLALIDTLLLSEMCCYHLPWKLLLISDGKVFPRITTLGSITISRLRPLDPVTSRCPPPPSSRSVISLSCRSRRTSCHSPLSRR